MMEQRYQAAELEPFCVDLLRRLGFSIEDAAVAAASLVRADLEGTSSHGISRLPMYVKRVREGRITAKPDIRMQHHGSVLHVDGDNGLGQVVCTRAIEEAIR